MKVHHYPSDDFKLPDSVLTIGTFDGVHLGHQKILRNLALESQKRGHSSVVVTFKTHPQHVLKPESQHSLKLITTLDEKTKLLEGFGIEHLVVLEFDLPMSQRSSSWFIEEVLKKHCSANVLVLGYDHRFGNGREGGFEYLSQNKEKWGLELVEISREDVDSNAVSSTSIRNFLSMADFDSVRAFLGRDFEFSGKVVLGRQLGRTIGFPTANLAIDPNKMIPPVGVYAVCVYVRDRKLKGMMNVGFNPTIEGKGFSVEVNLFDFNEDIYGENLTVLPLKKIRDERKFDNLDSLKAQILKDKEESLIVMSEMENKKELLKK